jgi:hypothetical protein
MGKYANAQTDITYNYNIWVLPGPSDLSLIYKWSAATAAEHNWYPYQTRTNPPQQPPSVRLWDPRNRMGGYLASMIWSLLDFDHWLCRGNGLALYEGVLDAIEIWVGGDCCARYDMDALLRVRLSNAVCSNKKAQDKLRRWGLWVTAWRAACREVTTRDEFKPKRPVLHFPRRKPPSPPLTGYSQQEHDSIVRFRNRQG